MKRNQIKPGCLYKNGKGGTTTRLVVAIGDEYLPSQCFNADGKFAPGETGVKYIQKGEERTISLTSFAAWAGEEVKDQA